MLLRALEVFYWTLYAPSPTVSPPKCQYNRNSSSVSSACVCVCVCNVSKSTEHVCINRGSAPSLHSHSAGPLSLAPTVKANSDCLRSEPHAIRLPFPGMGGWEAKASHFPQSMAREGGAGDRCTRGVCLSTCTLPNATRAHTLGHHH